MCGTTGITRVLTWNGSPVMLWSRIGLQFSISLMMLMGRYVTLTIWFYLDELFFFFNVTDRPVFDAIHGVKSEAVGLDGISIRFFRLILLSILPYLTHMFNTVLTCSTFPEA
jgi:hypothetical protein